MKTVKLLKELISHRIANQIDSFLSNLVLDLTVQFFQHFTFVCLTFKYIPCLKQFIYFVKQAGMNQNNMLC